MFGSPETNTGRQEGRAAGCELPPGPRATRRLTEGDARGAAGARQAGGPDGLAGIGKRRGPPCTSSDRDAGGPRRAEGWTGSRRPATGRTARPRAVRKARRAPPAAAGGSPQGHAPGNPLTGLYGALRAGIGVFRPVPAPGKGRFRPWEPFSGPLSAVGGFPDPRTPPGPLRRSRRVYGPGASPCRAPAADLASPRAAGAMACHSRAGGARAGRLVLGAVRPAPARGRFPAGGRFPGTWSLAASARVGNRERDDVPVPGGSPPFRGLPLRVRTGGRGRSLFVTNWHVRSAWSPVRIPARTGDQVPENHPKKIKKGGASPFLFTSS